MQRCHFLILAVLIVIAIQMAAWWATMGGIGVTDPVMAGVDGNMRLMRVLHWLDQGSWFAGVFPYSNAPFGDVLHWTRPMDFLLVGVAAPVALIGNWDQGIWFAGLVISPLLLAGTIAVYWAFLKDNIQGLAFVLLAALISVQPVVHNYYSMARPDHHGLLGLLFVGCFFAIYRVMAVPSHQSLAILAGLFGGMAVWVSPEGLLGLMLAAAGLGLLWLCQGGGYGLALVRMLQGATMVLVVGFLLERSPNDWTSIELDRLSIVYLALIAFYAGLWTIMARIVVLGQLAMAQRVLVGTIGLMLPLGLTLLIFPVLASGPMGQVDPQVMAIWFTRIVEVQPLAFHDLEHKGKAAFMLIPVFWGVGFVLWSVVERQGVDRFQALYLGLALLVTIGLGLFQVRWLLYAGLIGAVPLCQLLLTIWRWDGAWRGIPMRAPVFLVVVVSHLVIGGSLILIGKADELAGAADTAENKCDWEGLKTALPSGPDRRDDGQRFVFFSTTHDGPALLYRFRQRVVGTPYHRNTRAILDTHAVLSASGDRQLAGARDILAAHEVDWLVICMNNKETANYLKQESRNLTQMMAEGAVPDWLSPVDLQGGSTKQFRVYRFQKRD